MGCHATAERTRPASISSALAGLTRVSAANAPADAHAVSPTAIRPAPRGALFVIAWTVIAAPAVIPWHPLIGTGRVPAVDMHVALADLRPDCGLTMAAVHLLDQRTVGAHGREPVQTGRGAGPGATGHQHGQRETERRDKTFSHHAFSLRLIFPGARIAAPAASTKEGTAPCLRRYSAASDGERPAPAASSSAALSASSVGMATVL